MHNLVIFGQTPMPSCLGPQQEDSSLSNVLIQKVQWIEAALDLRMAEAQANFYIFFFQIFKPPSFGPQQYTFDILVISYVIEKEQSNFTVTNYDIRIFYS